MADEKVSDMPEVTTLAEADLFYAVDISAASSNKISKANAVKTLITEVQNAFVQNQRLAKTTLSIAASAIAIDFALDGNSVVTLDEAATLSLPTNLAAGLVLELTVVQDGTGGWTLSFNAAIDFAGTDSAVNQTAVATTIYRIWTDDGTNIRALKIWEDD